MQLPVLLSLRLGTKIKSFKARQIKTMLRIYERIASESNDAERIILKLDDQFNNEHAFSLLQGLELVTSKTWIPKNEKASRALLLWVLETSGRTKFCDES